MKRKRNIFFAILFSSILLIEIYGIVFVSKKLFFNQVEDLKQNNNIINNDMFAIMIEQADETYAELENNTWPTNMQYNSNLSGCLDASGNPLNGILSYDKTTNVAHVSTSETAYCYLYFDILKPNINVVDASNNTLAVTIEKGTYELKNYCINTSLDISSCTWNNISSNNFNIPITESNNYYLHLKDEINKIYHSGAVSAVFYGGDFNISASGYQTIKISDIETSGSDYKIKYASGNQDSTYFGTNGTDITSSLSFTASSNGIYTISLLNTSDVVLLTKKVYIHNFARSTTRSRSTTASISGFTSIVGSPFANTGRATATLSGTSLSLTAKSGTYYTRSCDEYSYSCPNGGSLSGTTCTGSTYNQIQLRTAQCACIKEDGGSSCWSAGSTGPTPGTCDTGYEFDTSSLDYTQGNPYDGTVSNCDGVTEPNENLWFYYDSAYTWKCNWVEDYAATKGSCADYTYYYRYTVGVIVE